jgi:hypothetical protein
MFASNNFVSKRVLLLLVFAAAAIFLISGCASMNGAYPPGTLVVDSMQSLDSYGDWVMSARFGRAWRPYAVQSWRPYRYGRWVSTEYGWTWVSYEPYGWITYHYGYWYYDQYYGWIWIPGQQWSPANVEWLHFDNYIGWAPMPPPGIIIGDPWSVNFGFYWNFTDIHHFAGDRVYDHILPRVQKQKTVVRQAPDVDYVQKMGRVRVEKIPAKPNMEQIQKLQRMKLPPSENKTVERRTLEVQKKVLKPKPQSKAPQKPKKDKD